PQYTNSPTYSHARPPSNHPPLASIHTRNSHIYDSCYTQNTNIKRFPLRHTITITTVNANPTAPATQLKIQPVHTQTRDLTITAIESKPNVAAALFQIPAGFHKADPQRDDTQKAPVQVLSMEPAQQ